MALASSNDTNNMGLMLVCMPQSFYIYSLYRQKKYHVSQLCSSRTPFTHSVLQSGRMLFQFDMFSIRMAILNAEIFAWVDGLDHSICTPAASTSS